MAILVMASGSFYFSPGAGGVLHEVTLKCQEDDQQRQQRQECQRRGIPQSGLTSLRRRFSPSGTVNIS
jgi:hypothetical protein